MLSVTLVLRELPTDGVLAADWSLSLGDAHWAGLFVSLQHLGNGVFGC